MEQEIDLRPYLQAVVRQWRLIVGVTALAALAAALITISLPRQASARGDVLLIARSPQLTLDARFVDRDATMVTNSINQRQALVDLASSSELEARVAAQLGIAEYEPGALLGRISVASRSDLLQIEATGDTPADARQLAEAWARSYEIFVNEVYSNSASTRNALSAPLDSAQQRYDQAQSDLSAFYASGDLVRARQSVARVQGLLDGGTAAQIQLYTEHLTRTQELSLILEDARSVEAQYERGGVADLGARISALVVRARLAGSDRLPLYLNLNSADAIADDGAVAASLAEFVRVLEAERDRRVAQAEALASNLAAGNGAAVGLSPDVRARYEADLAAAQSALALAEGQEKRLLLQRDVALRSIEVLQAKSDERQVDEVIPDVSVRFVGAAAQPPRSILSRLVLNLATAVVASLALALTFIVGRELLRRRGAPGQGARAPAERPADTPVASD